MRKRKYKVELEGRYLQIVDYPGEKGTIIALHGLTGTHKNMIHYAQSLQGDYRFIACDLRGRGDSSGMDDVPSIFSHAEDVKELLTVLGIKDPILLGHSMGAFVSAIVASEVPTVKCLILLDGAARMSGRQHDIVRPSLGRLRKSYESKRAYIEELKQLYKRLGIKWTDDVQEIVEYEIHGTGNGWIHKSANENIEEDFSSFDFFNPIKVMGKITCETLLIQADGDIGPFPPFFTDIDYAETKKHTSKLTMYNSDSNHYTMVFEKREDILTVIRDFLDGLIE